MGVLKFICIEFIEQRLIHERCFAVYFGKILPKRVFIRAVPVVLDHSRYAVPDSFDQRFLLIAARRRLCGQHLKISHRELVHIHGEQSSVEIE